MKLIIDNYKEIQQVKKMLNEHCENTIKVAHEEFKTKRIPILKQIDEYLLNIASQLKGTKPCDRDSWIMESSPYVSRREDSYPARTIVTFDNGGYTLKVILFSRFSGKEGTNCTIKNGMLFLHTDYDHVKKEGDQYEDTIIQTWRDLKLSIHNTIAKDFEKVQLNMNTKLSNEQARQNMYDNFEV